MTSKINRFLVVLLVTFLAIVIFILWKDGRTEEHKIYNPSKSVIVPKYTVKSNPDGSYNVYQSGQVVIPKYVVKDGKDLDGS